MLVIYAVLVFYVSSQKGEFIIVSHTNVAMPYGEESILQVTLVHVLAISNSEKVSVRNIYLKLQRLYIAIN